MKKLIIIGCFAILCTPLMSQVTVAEDILRAGTDVSDTIIGWKIGGMLGLNLSQATFVNWAGGGDNSLAFNILNNISVHRKSKKSSLDLTVDIGYGMQRIGKYDKYVKIDDKYEISGKYGRQISKKWFYGAFANLRSQFSPGYDYPLKDSVKISDFFAPAFIIGAVGIDFRPGKGFTGFVAPLTSKITIVNSQPLADEGAYGVDGAEYDENDSIIKHGLRVRHEVGGYMRFVLKRHVDKTKNVLVLTKLDVFSNYLEKPENIDLNWELIVIVKINKYISATLSTQFFYDDDVKLNIDKDNDGIIDLRGPRLQFKEVMGIGFSIKL